MAKACNNCLSSSFHPTEALCLSEGSKHKATSLETAIPAFLHIRSGPELTKITKPQTLKHPQACQPQYSV